MVAVLSYESNNSSTTDASSYTFTAQDIGALGGIVHVGTYGSSVAGGAVSGITLGGSAMTMDVTSAVSSNVCSAIGTITDPGGGTADIVVTFGSSKGRCGIGVWAASGADATPSDTDSVSVGGVNNVSLGLTVTAGGYFVAVCGGGSATDIVAYDWTNATERFDISVESFSRFSGADGTASASVGIANNNGAVATITASGACYDASAVPGFGGFNQYYDRVAGMAG